MSFRLKLDNSLFPIQTFFNAISDDSFVRVIESLSNGVGRGINVCHCSFPGDLDPWDEPFEGVCFSIFEEEVIISENEMFKYVKLVCTDFIEKNPGQRAVIEKLLKQFPAHP